MDNTLEINNNKRVFSNNPAENLTRHGTTGVGGPSVNPSQGLTDAQLRVVGQRESGQTVAPSPFTAELSDVPSSALGSISRQDVFKTKRDAESRIRTTLADQNVLQNKILEALQPTEAERNIDASIRESAGAQEAGVLGAKERALGTTRVARAVQGEQALITSQEQGRRRVLADELNALVNERATTVSALSQALEFSQENMAALQTLQQLTQPDVLNTQVDGPSGQIIATIQDADGNVRTEVIGSVTPETDTSLRNTGTFTDEQGNLILFGVDSSGQIVKQAVGKAQVDPLQSLNAQIKQEQLRGAQLDNQQLIQAIKEGSRQPDVTQDFAFGTPEYTVASMVDSAQFGKNLNQDQRESVAQALSALSGIETLNAFLFEQADGRAQKKELSSIAGTGPLKGRARTLMSQLGGDAEAGAINATIQGLIPTVARGIFGEVGVLTDADIRNYKQTLASLDKPEDQNKLVSVIMLDVLSQSIGSTFEIAAANQQDVSRFVPIYENVTRRVAEEKAALLNVRQEALDMFDSVVTGTGGLSSTPAISNTQF